MVVTSSEARGLSRRKAVTDRLQGRIVYRTVEISHLRFEMTDPYHFETTDPHRFETTGPHRFEMTGPHRFEMTGPHWFEMTGSHHCDYRHVKELYR